LKVEIDILHEFSNYYSEIKGIICGKSSSAKKRTLTEPAK
jgi:hypothetical protein